MTVGCITRMNCGLMAGWTGMTVGLSQGLSVVLGVCGG